MADNIAPASQAAPSQAAPWLAPSTPGHLNAVTAIPGSKSLTARALVLAALSERPSKIVGALTARDTSLMVRALRDFGVGITVDDLTWSIDPGPLQAGTVGCGLAGTVMRFLPPVAALATGTSRFDGDPVARTRPMNTLIGALRQAGVRIDDDGRASLPFSVLGTGSVAGGTVSLDFSASSQFVSALLLAGARFEHGIEIVHAGATVPSLPHIAMTCAALRAAGVEVDDSKPDRWVVAPGAISAPDVLIEPDLSNAAPFLAAAMVCGGSVTVPRWPESSTQAGEALRGLLPQLGAEVRLDSQGLTVTGTGHISALVADLHEVGELTPVLAALCALADGPSTLSGVGHIRGHETDRLAAIRIELGALGAEVTETADGLIINPAPLRAGLWHAYADHRMAQAGAVLGLRVAGLTVDDIACTSKTVVDFPGLWASMLAQIQMDH